MLKTCHLLKTSFSHLRTLPWLDPTDQKNLVIYMRKGASSVQVANLLGNISQKCSCDFPPDLSACCIFGSTQCEASVLHWSQVVVLITFQILPVYENIMKYLNHKCNQVFNEDWWQDFLWTIKDFLSMFSVNINQQILMGIGLSAHWSLNFSIRCHTATILNYFLVL